MWETPINGHWTVLNTSALSTISSYGSISIYLSSIVTNEDKTKYVSFYLLLANSMTAFNNQQYRGFPSIFGVVGNWLLTGSMSLGGIRNQGFIIVYVHRLDLILLLVWNRGPVYHWKLASVGRRLDLLLLV